eukprot:1485109-Amphidinium_carterae.1
MAALLTIPVKGSAVLIPKIATFPGMLLNTLFLDHFYFKGLQVFSEASPLATVFRKQLSA